MSLQIWIDDQIADRGAYAQLGDLNVFSGREITRDALTDADVLIVRSVTHVAPSLLNGTRIRFVGTVTTGVDHLDIAYLQEQSIEVATAAGFNARPVAEYVLASLFLLADQRCIPMQHLTLGVVGVGRIGSMIGGWAKSIGMSVLFNDPPREMVGDTGPWMSINALLAASDIVTLHVPLTHEGTHATVGMADADWLSRMNHGASLINTSRGGIVDEKALFSAIEANSVSNAVVDTWLNEPHVNRELVGRCRIATPHIAGHSIDAKFRGSRLVREALADWCTQANDLSGHRVELHAPKVDAGVSDDVIKHRNAVACVPDDVKVTALADATKKACPIELMDQDFRAALCDKNRGFDAARLRAGSRAEFSHRFDDMLS